MQITMPVKMSAMRLMHGARMKIMPGMRKMKKMSMKRNMSVTDRALHIGSGLALMGLGMSGRGGVAGKAFSILGGALLFEGVTSYSVAYDLLGISTRRED